MDGQLAEYYNTFFPYRTWFQWLNHTPVPGKDFTNREFAFTIRNNSDQEIYLRYQSFADAERFRDKVRSLTPERFEIGAVYNVQPKDKRLIDEKNYRPLSKELVFDIDLTDYDEYRTCCQGKQVCVKCWQYITVAVDVMNATFREDFGYSNFFWVFSGRRGIHAWVSDIRARSLDDAQRSALVNYLAVTRKMDHGHITIQRPWHPMVQRSFDICKHKFEHVVLIQQDPWYTPKQTTLLLNRLKRAGPKLIDALAQKWGGAPSPSIDKWRQIDEAAKPLANVIDARALLEAKQDIILEYMYPKLDANVSTKRNHLLKSPFCVHPDTGKVCVPISIDTYADFDPDNVPLIGELLAEHKSGAAAGKGQLEPYLSQFRKFVAQLNRPEKRPADSLEF